MRFVLLLLVVVGRGGGGVVVVVDIVVVAATIITIFSITIPNVYSNRKKEKSWNNSLVVWE